MKRLLSALLVSAIAVFSACGKNPAEIASRIRWTGQSSVIIETGGKTIYIDPLQIKNGKRADIILITHGHFDHMSLDDIAKITGPGTTILAPADCAKDIEPRFNTRITVVEPGFKKSVKGIDVEAVPAYNVTKTQFHPRSNNWVGYILTVEGNRIYHTGDTERIPEMKNIHADIILVPLGQTYTMNTVQDAVESVLDTGAKIAIPFHFGMYEGTAADADTFTGVLKGRVMVVRKGME